MSAVAFRMNEQLSSVEEVLAQTARTISPALELQIKDKYKTFSRFNYRDAIREAKMARKKKGEQSKLQETEVGAALANFILGLTSNESRKQQKSGRKNLVLQQLAGIKSERRERFKRAGINTFQIIKHYIEKQNFKPTDEQLYLMKGLAELKQFSEQNPLDGILKRIYRFMNEAVDFNQFRFLCLLIMLAADICLQFRDFNRAFYFYNEAKLFASYSAMFQIKTEALMAMGLIAMETKHYSEAIVLLKKALQYSWKTRSLQSQLLVYDYLGSAYYYQGKLKESQYYHKRFTQGEYELNDSAIKRISTEMLQEYEQHISSLERKNLTSLFLEYINIPIVDLTTVPPPTEPKRRIYENYDEEGSSPRKKKANKKFEFQDFPEVFWQIEKLVKDDYEFITEIPNPDVQRTFMPSQRFGKPRKNISFEQSSEYHKIVGGSENKIDLSQLHSNSLEKRIEKALSQRDNPDWWQQMKDKIRKNQLQKVGQMRDRVFNSHQSYYKYPQERRRSYSLKNEKIKQSFNKTLLDWIDPPK